MAKASCRIAILAFVVIFGGSATAIAQVSYSAAELAQRNEAYWKSIHSLDMLFTTELRFQSRCAKSAPARWTMVPGRERLRYTEIDWNRAFDSSPPAGRQYDYYFDGTQTFELSGEDLSRKAPTSELDAKSLGINARLYSGLTDHYTTVCPAYGWMLMRRWSEQFTDRMDPNATFSSLIRDNETTKPVKGLDARGDTIWSFQVRPPKSQSKSKHAPQYMDIVVNESKGFIIQKAVVYACGGGTDVKTKKRVFTNTELVVLEYAKLTENRFFPKQVAIRTYRVDGKPEGCGQYTYRVDEIRINEKIPDGLFDFTIPEFVEVRHHPSVSKGGIDYCVISIWGPDNKPARTFSEPGEYSAYVAQQTRADLARKAEEYLTQFAKAYREQQVQQASKTSGRLR